MAHQLTVEQLSGVLSQTLSPDATTRKTGEACNHGSRGLGSYVMQAVHACMYPSIIQVMRGLELY